MTVKVGSRGMTPIEARKLQVLCGYLDNMALDQPIISDPFIENGKVFVEITVEGRNSLRWYDRRVEVEQITPFKVELDYGTLEQTNMQTLYSKFSEESNSYKIFATSSLPVGSFLPIAYIGIQSEAEILDHGPMVMQRTTEMVSHNDQGAISRMREQTRLANKYNWWSGCEVSFKEVNGVASVEMLGGVFYQMNRQKIEKIDSGTNGIYAMGVHGGDIIKNNQKINNIYDLKYLNNGTEIGTNQFIAFNIYAVGNNTPDNCKLAVHIPGHSHDTLKELEEFIQHGQVPAMSNEYRGVGFPVGAVLLKYLGNGVFQNAYTVATETVEYNWREFAMDWKSPNYPNNYPNNVNQEYSLTGPTNAEKIMVQFNPFNTEAGYDYLYMKSNSVSTSSYAWRYHGNNGNFSTNVFNSRVVKGLFKTDGSVGRTGWKAEVYKAWCREVITDIESSTKMLDTRGK